MADSTITKKALASALQELMEEMPFDKIKIFDIEFFQEISKPEYEDAEFALSSLCQYFYENRDF